jgi:hypothetical protein
MINLSYVALNLTGAVLVGAVLKGANLTGAVLVEANLTDAFLYGVELAMAKGLTRKQLDVAFDDSQTTLPPGLDPPKHWPSAAADSG